MSTDQTDFLAPLPGISILQGDCVEWLRELPADSFSACVTDPPYHLTAGKKGGSGAASLNLNSPAGRSRITTGFMGKTWDGGDIAFRPETWAAVLRVLKPGAYLIAFASTRGYHRMVCAIEDAGFVIHPMLGWIFGSGWPKAHKIEAEGWEDWRYGLQSLKPALEPICLAQKPMSENTGTANVLRWGTGALNIEAGRVGTNVARPARSNAESRSGLTGTGGAVTYGSFAVRGSIATGETDLGRWPANLAHDGSPEVMEAFARFNAPGQLADVSFTAPSQKTSTVYGKLNREGEASAARRYTNNGSTNFSALPGQRRNDSGSPARFFYAAKASKAERLGTTHPTVKPVALMEWLVKLVTPPGGEVLDPFCGTGSTLVACDWLGFDATGIEQDPQTCVDAEQKILRLHGGKPKKKKRPRTTSPLDPAAASTQEVQS